jgi:hypothetical protein
MSKLTNAKELLTAAKNISDWLEGEKFDSLRVECMNQLGFYSTTVDVESRFIRWVKKHGKITRKFDPEDVYNVKVYALKPPTGMILDAVYIEGNQIVLDLNKTLDYESFRLEIAYRMDEEWLNGIVYSRHSPEPLTDATKYNLSAQLRDPNSLIEGFSEFQIEEYPLTARVLIQENINTNIPQYVKQMTEIEANILKDYDPRAGLKIMALQRRRAQLYHDLKSEDLQTKMNQLSYFLRPQNFLNYITRLDDSDFRLHCCEWGEDLFQALGLLKLPKAMNVISRTDLSLKKPASAGAMIYQSGKFSQDIQNVFKEKSKKKYKFR